MTVVRGILDERKRLPNPDSDRELWQLTDSQEASMHSYYDLTPWSPDGQRIVFSSYDEARTYMSVYWMNALQGPPRLVGTTRFTDSHSGVKQQWMGEGASVLYSDADEAGEFLNAVDVETMSRSRFDGNLRMLHPRERLAVFHSNVNAGQPLDDRDTKGVFLTDLDRGEPWRIASIQQALELHPDKRNIGHCRLFVKHTKWSPGGQRLFFVFTNENFAAEEKPLVKSIYTVNADGSELRHLCSLPIWNHPSWHPDGKRILLNSTNERGEKRLVLIDADTGEAKTVTEKIDGVGHPSFSPDGNFIVIDRVVKGQGELHLLDVRRDTAERIVSFPVFRISHQGTHIHPVWARDGSAIIYNSDQSGHSELYRIQL